MPEKESQNESSFAQFLLTLFVDDIKLLFINKDF